jgi:glutaredoxin-like protein NrdH
MKITLYTMPECGPCTATKHALTSRNVPFETRDLATDDAALFGVRRLGYRTAPVVVVEDGDAVEHWAGFQLDRITELAAKVRMNGGGA